MKKLVYLAIVFSWSTTFAQEQRTDTTKINLGETEVLIIKMKKGEVIIDSKTTIYDTIDASPEEDLHEGRWSGIDFGATMLLNSSMKNSFPSERFLENDPGKSFYWNLNIVDHKFNIYRHYVGFTTGFGVNFTQIGIKDDNILYDNYDSLWLVKDTVNHYSKNKLRGIYLQIPLLFEFSTNENPDKSFYFAAGILGGVRVGSALIQKIDRDNFENKQKIKGTYSLNPFKVDALIRMGYGHWGIFANYALMPLFDKDKTATAYPLTFGISMYL